MSRPGYRFEKGDGVEIDGVLHEILERSKDGIQLRSAGPGGRKRWVPNDEFWMLYEAEREDGAGRRLVVRREIFGRLPAVVAANVERQYDDFAPRWQLEAAMRLDYVQGCACVFSRPSRRRRGKYPMRPEGFYRIGQIVARLRQRFRPECKGKALEDFSGPTIRDWFWRWRNSGFEYVALIPGHDSKGKTGAQLEGEVIAVLGHWLREKYLILEHPPASVVYSIAMGDIDRRNEGRAVPLEKPSYPTFMRLIDQWIDPYEQVLKRFGAEEAGKRYPQRRRAPQPSLPLELVEIDHTPMDILLVDEDGKESEGDRRKTIQKGKNPKKKTFKVWLTLIRDKATKMILGFYISREAPSWLSVLAAMSMAIRPKDLTGLDVLSEWPAFGVPVILAMDNGAEFHSLSLRAVMGQLRIQPRRMPRRKGHMKGGIERALGVVSQDFLSMLPGRLFSNMWVRGDYPSEQRAAVTLKTLVKMFTEYVVDIENNRPTGRLLGRSPLQAWNDLVPAVGVRMPPDGSDLDAILSVAIDRTVTPVGITFLGLVYQSKELQLIRRREGHLGEKLMVKADPNDMGSILVMDEGRGPRKRGQWISVPCNYPELSENVSIIQWRETVSIARQMTEPGRRVALATLRKARLRLAEQATKLGAKPSKIKAEDIPWFREHVDDPMFDIAFDERADTDPSVTELRKRRTRPAEAQDPPGNVGEGGRQPPEDAPPGEDTAAAEAVREVGESSDVGSVTKSPPTSAPATTTFPPTTRADYDDPDNW